jgi:hypothetical protein
MFSILYNVQDYYGFSLFLREGIMVSLKPEKLKDNPAHNSLMKARWLL